MSSARGGSARGRGRSSGSGQYLARGASRAQSASRGRGSFGGSSATRGNAIAPSAFGQASRPNVHRQAVAPSAARANGHKAFTATGLSGAPSSRGSWQERYQALTKAREQERTHAIRSGLIADPDKPRSLADALTLVGTCQEMCAEYERVQRVVQKDVWPEEADQARSAYSIVDQVPDEARMVKKFRRAAAGLEEQLPSDLRPPAVLQRTCDYLFNEVVGQAETLQQVHHFVWDRTRAVRNDFSIQQVTKAEDLRIAVDCYERIARFHILSLHQLALKTKPYDKYDSQQEREQLDRTLLSLMQYYDDCHDRFALPNEAEFRAYSIVFQLQGTPDLEDRVQSWPRDIIRNAQVQTALSLYAAATSTVDPQGPLNPRAKHVLAQEDWQHFWTLVASKRVSYLMACVAEIYFHVIRRTALNAIWRTFRGNPKSQDQEWEVDELHDLFAFDDIHDVYDFFSAHEFFFNDEDEARTPFTDMTSVRGAELPPSNSSVTKQLRSMVVENKRFGRTLPAIINGLTVKAAMDRGMATFETREEGMDDAGVVDVIDEGGPNNGMVDDGETLFVPESKTMDEEEQDNRSTPSGSPFTFGKVTSFKQEQTEKPSIFGSAFAASGGTSSDAPKKAVTFNFGQPSTFGGPSKIFSGAPEASAELYQCPTLSDNSRKSAQANAQPAAASLSHATTSNTSPMQPATEQSVPAFTPGVFSFNRPTGQDSTAASQPSSTLPLQVPSTSSSTPFASFTPSAAGQPKAPGGLGHSADVELTPKSGPFLFSPAPPSQQPVESGVRSVAQPTSIVPSSFDRAESAATPPPSNFGRAETNPPQTHFITPAITDTTAHPTSTSHSLPASQQATTVAHTSLRRVSATPDSKPRTPSPLAHSFSAEDVAGNSTGEVSTETAFKRQSKTGQSSDSPKLISHDPVDAFKDQSLAQVSKVSEVDPSSIFRRIARDIVDAPASGFLDQYLEYVVGNVITSVQEQLYTERVNAEADQFRQTFLQYKYGKLWRELYWRNRRALQGRKRRERAQLRLRESRASASDIVSTADDTSNQSSRRGSITGSQTGRLRSKRELVDDLYQQTARGTRPSDMSHSKQAMAAERQQDRLFGDAPDTGAFSKIRHERNHGGSDSGSRTPLALTSRQDASALARSSFLGFSLPTDGSNRSSGTRTNYFRLKALGIASDGEPSPARGVKRRRSSSTGNDLIPSSPSYLQSSYSMVEAPTAGNRPSPQIQSSMSKSNDEDEALFARLKAARESLQQSSAFMQTQMAEQEEAQRSGNTSRSSNESPSMARARADVRLRASQTAAPGEAIGSGRDLPAYRLRESRFVPREQYDKAIVRAREIREARSRESSRPMSRMEGDAVGETAHKTLHAAQQPANYQKDESFGQSQRPDFESSNAVTQRLQTTSIAPAVNTNAPNLLSFTKGPQAPPKGPHPPPSASIAGSDMNAPGNLPFSTSNNTQQPFANLNQTEFHAYGSDFSVQPSQIDKSLSRTFGEAGPSASQGFIGAQARHPTLHSSLTPQNPRSHVPNWVPAGRRAPASVSDIYDTEDVVNEDEAQDFPSLTEERSNVGELEEEAPEHVQDGYREYEYELSDPEEVINGHENQNGPLLDDSQFGDGDTEDGSLDHVPDSYPQYEYGHVNPYAALQMPDDDDETERDEHSEEDEDGEGNGGLANGHGSEEDEDGYINDFADDEDNVDGKFDDGSEEPGSDNDEEYDEDSFDRPQADSGAFPGYRSALPAKAEALQGVGGTEDDAIELSD